MLKFNMFTGSNKACSVASNYSDTSVDSPSKLNLRRNFPLGASQKSPFCQQIANLSAVEQEKLLLKNMLNALKLIPDDLVWSERRSNFDCVIHLHPDIHVELKQECLHLAELAGNFAAVTSFVNENSTTEQSLTRHALATCMLQYRRQYILAVSVASDKYIQGRMTLKLLKQDMVAMYILMETLADVALNVYTEKLQGAAILSLLYNLHGTCGVSSKKEVYIVALGQAIKPFGSMLISWMKGEPVRDPKREFMMQERRSSMVEGLLGTDPSLTPFVCNQDNVPAFLAQDTDNILKAGCYAKVINTVQEEFNEPNTVTAIVESHLSPDSITVPSLHQSVNSILEQISATLFNLMRKYGNLKDHLMSLKEVFLFVRADCFKRFIDFSKGQLLTSSRLSCPMVLKNLLADAVTGSASTTFTQQNMDLIFHEESLLARIAQVNLQTGRCKDEEASRYITMGDAVYTFENIATDLRGGWILHHLLTPNVRSMYEVLMGMRLQLFLAETYCVDVMGTTRLRSAHCILHKMLLFVQSMSSYLSLFSVEQEWSRLQRQLLACRTVESLVRTHSEYVERIYHRFMLHNLTATSHLLSVTKTVLHATFSLDKMLNRDNPVVHQGSSKNEDCGVDVEKELLPLHDQPSDTVQGVVDFFDQQFDNRLAAWMEGADIKSHEQLLDLLAMNDVYVVRR